MVRDFWDTLYLCSYVFAASVLQLEGKTMKCHAHGWLRSSWLGVTLSKLSADMEWYLVVSSKTVSR